MFRVATVYASATRPVCRMRRLIRPVRPDNLNAAPMMDHVGRASNSCTSLSKSEILNGFCIAACAPTSFAKLNTLRRRIIGDGESRGAVRCVRELVYSHGGPEWEAKLRQAVTRLEKS
jgi:hypothetical protein